jgi:hypothetical protein
MHADLVSGKRLARKLVEMLRILKSETSKSLRHASPRSKSSLCISEQHLPLSLGEKRRGRK